MPIVESDLVCYGSVHRPEDDSSPSGGGIDPTHRPDLVQLSGVGDLEAVSDGPDTRTVTVTYRNPSGVIATAEIVLDGETPVRANVSAERVLKVSLSATDPDRTVTVRPLNGQAVCFIGPGEQHRSMLFIGAVSGDVAIDRYEKLFWRNENPELALLDAEVVLTADPASVIEIGLDPQVDSDLSVANRLEAPPGVVFVDNGVAQSVPGGDLPPGSAIGVWIRLALEPDHPSVKGTFTTQISGRSV